MCIRITVGLVKCQLLDCLMGPDPVDVGEEQNVHFYQVPKGC